LDGFHELPLSILYLGFCPKGAEGTTLATLQTFTSLAVMMSNNLSLLSLRFWPVDEPTVTSEDFSGIWKLTLLTALAQSIGRFWVGGRKGGRDGRREERGKRNTIINIFAHTLCLSPPSSFFILLQD